MPKPDADLCMRVNLPLDKKLGNQDWATGSMGLQASGLAGPSSRGPPGRWAVAGRGPRAAGPSGRRAAGPSRAAGLGPLDRGPAFSKTPARRGYCMDGWPNSNPPCSNNLFLFLFLFLPFSKAILKPAELSSLRNIVSSLYQLFVPRFAMAVFMCIYLHYRIYIYINSGTRRSNYPQFSGLLIFQNI